jgi:hypothetical protein
MDLIAQNVLDYSRVYLNDVASNQWNNGVLLPYLKLAWDELQVEFQSRDIAVMDEVSEVLALDSNMNELLAPEDMITPFHLMERPRGADDNSFTMMTPVTWEPSGNNETIVLGTWTWRGQKFIFPKHSTDVDIYIHYLRHLFDLDDENSPLQLNNCRVVLAKRTAGLAARYGNSNPTRADLLDQEAMYFMQKITGIEVKTKQNTQGVRRRGYFKRGHAIMR